jgi:hypothetical protein
MPTKVLHAGLDAASIPQRPSNGSRLEAGMTMKIKRPPKAA